jgi:hypothetical protein
MPGRLATLETTLIAVLSAVDYQVAVRARRDGLDGEALLRVDVNDHDCGEAALDGSWNQYSFSLPARARRPGFNDLRPMTRAETPGSRPPAVAVDWVRFVRTGGLTGPR